MNGIKIIRKQGTLGRELPNEDATSGLIVYGEANTHKTLILSVQDAEKKGITERDFPVLHYHIVEFFRIGQGAKLYVQGVDSSDREYSELKVLQNFAQGSIRQMAVCDLASTDTNLTTCVKKLQEIATELSTAHTPLSILFSVKITNEEFSNLPDLHSLNSDKVSVVIGQDGKGKGSEIAQTTPSVSCIGAVLGAVAKAQVQESIAWVEKQNMVSVAHKGTQVLELDIPAFCNGELLEEYSAEDIEQINEKGYLFLVKHTGIIGSYLNDSFTATALDSDFAFIENNRTIDKVSREVNRVLLPKLSAPAYISPETGNIDPSTLKSLEALVDDALSQMRKKGELSGYQVWIDPNQQLLQTSRLNVVLKIVPVGVLREIVVEIGLYLKTT